FEAAGDDFARAVEDRVREQVAACLALFEPHAGERRQIERAQDGDRQSDDRCYAGDLLGLDAQAHGARQAPLLSSSASRWSLLWRVFRLMPSISAARVLLPPVCSSVSRISWRSASATVVPGFMPAGEESAPADAGRVSRFRSGRSDILM